MKNRKNIYKGAVVLFIAAFMVISTLPAMADSEKPYIPTTPEHPVNDVLAQSKEYYGNNNNVMKLPTQALKELPEQGALSDFSDFYLQYDNGLVGAPIGLTSSGDLYWANHFPSSMLAGYNGWELDEVYANINSDTGATYDASVLIYDYANPNPADSPLASETMSVSPASGGSWYTFSIDPAPLIDETKPLFVIIHLYHLAGDFPASFDSDGTQNPGYTNLVTLDGITWLDACALYGLCGDCMIRAGLTDAGPSQTEGCDFAVEINSPSGIVNSDPTKINISIYNFGEDGINEVKVLADIFKEVPGVESNVCCQDVEGDDPMNWLVLDNGDSDSWTVSDRRYHSEGHSWRNTPGSDREPCPPEDDPGCYLGHAADSGPDELWLDACQDLEGAEYGWIEFWDFCVGEFNTEGGYTIPVDYGTIAISNDCGDTWVDIPQSAFVAYDNDWRQTIVGLNTPAYLMDTVDFNVNIELTDEMSIKFIWTSDPHMQYEGWYIDDVCFYRGEPSTWELVWQGHEIFWDIPALFFDGMFYEFLLDWDPEPDTVYKIRVCGQVFDPAGCDTNPDNDCDETYVEIMDLCDVASVSTTIVGPSSILEICESPTYEIEIENLGTYPAVGFPVNLEVSRMASDKWFNGAESGGWMGFVYSPYPALSHYTDCPDFVYEGGAALAMATTDCDYPTAVPFQFDMMVAEDSFDLSADNIVAAELKFFAKYSFSEQITSAPLYDTPTVNCLGEVNMPDHWFITIQDPTVGYYIIRCTADSYNAVYVGQNGQWEGADAPGMHPGMFTMDLLDMMDQVSGLFDNKIVQIGFGVIMNNDEYILNPANTWSGLFIDNVEVIISYCDESTGEIVNTTIAPFLAPGDSDTVEITWEDACDYSTYCVCGVTDLDCDEVPENDKSCTITTFMESAIEPEWETIDLTDTGGDCGWIIVSKNPCDTFAGEPEEDQYFWCGNPDTGVYDPYMNDELVSVAFDLSGYDYGVLQFDTYYDIEYGYDYGKLFYSDDGGTHWYELGFFQNAYDENIAEGIYSDWHIESYVIPGGSANTKIKFLFVSDNVYEFNGWYLDDIVINGAFIGAGADILDFSPPGFPPDDWAVTNDGASSCTWTTNDAIGRTNYAGTGTCAAADADACGSSGPWPMDTSLISPEFDLSGSGSATLYWNEDRLFYGDTGIVEVSTNGGGSWSPLATFTTSYTGPNSVSLPVGSANTMVKFHYIATGWQYWWQVDDVQVIDDSFAVLLDEDFEPSLGLPWGVDPAHASNWYLSNSANAGGTAPELMFYYSPSFVGYTYVEIGPIDTSAAAAGMLNWKTAVQHFSNSFVIGVESSTNGVDFVREQEIVIDGMYGPETLTAGISAFGSTTTYIRIFFEGDSYDLDYWWIDDIEIVPLELDAVVFEDDAENGMDKWSCENYVAGDWWHETQEGPCQSAWYSGSDVLGTYLPGVQNVLFTEYDLSETELGEPYYSAVFSYDTKWDFAWASFYEQWSQTTDYTYFATGYVQISTDYGTTWHTLREYVASSGGWIHEEINIDAYLPNVIQIRFLQTSMPDAPVAEGWYVDCFELMFKHEIYCDTTPPVTTICIDEEAQEATLSAYDGADYIVTGVRATYYIHTANGVAGPTTEYDGTAIALVEGNNKIEYWSVDKASDLDCADEDNEESRKDKSVLIDTTDPTVTITAPAEGKLYIFGNEIMDRIFGDNTLCIGKVTIEATASDTGTGVTMVTFDIDGDTGYDDSSPYSYEFSKRFFGEVTVTATAFDAKGNSAQDTATFTIYSLGIGIGGE